MGHRKTRIVFSGAKMAVLMSGSENTAFFQGELVVHPIDPKTAKSHVLSGAKKPNRILFEGNHTKNGRSRKGIVSQSFRGWTSKRDQPAHG
jgi:hypothetical protein